MDTLLATYDKDIGALRKMPGINFIS